MARCFIGLLLLAALAACGQQAPATTLRSQTSGDLTISLESTAQPQINMAQRWVVSLADSAQRPVDGATVFLELEMPAMPMGQNKPLATNEGQGRYVAEGVFTMEGLWHVIVHVRSAGAEHRALFEVQVQPAP